MSDPIERWRTIARLQETLGYPPIGDALNDACDEIERLRQIAVTNGSLHRSAEGDVSAVIAELSAIDAETDEFEKRHNRECECDTIHATREVVHRIRAALLAPESTPPAPSPVSTPTEAHDG